MKSKKYNLIVKPNHICPICLKPAEVVMRCQDEVISIVGVDCKEHKIKIDLNSRLNEARNCSLL